MPTNREFIGNFSRIALAHIERGRPTATKLARARRIENDLIGRNWGFYRAAAIDDTKDIDEDVELDMRKSAIGYFSARAIAFVDTGAASSAGARTSPIYRALREIFPLRLTASRCPAGTVYDPTMKVCI